MERSGGTLHVPHLLLVRSGQDKGNPVCAAATGAAAAAAAALIKQLANSLDHEAAIPHSKLLPGRGHVQRASFHVLLSVQFSAVPAPPLSLSPTSLISTHRTRCLTISMLQQWQQSDCLCLCLSPSSLSSHSFSLALSVSLSLSGSVQFMI